MIKVYQDKTVHNDGTGTCQNACISSLLEIPLEQSAYITPDMDGDWREAWRIFLADRGYKSVRYSKDRVDRQGPELIKGYTIATVETDRTYPEGHDLEGMNIAHAVIMFNGILVHDPFPLGSNITRIFAYDKLVPLNNAERELHEMYSKGGFCKHGYKQRCAVCE